MWFEVVSTAAAAVGGVVPIAGPINVLAASVQTAGAGFVALRCSWLGAMWHRGTENGTDEFTAIGISAALLVGGPAIGAAVAGGAAGMPSMPVMVHYMANELVGDLLGIAGYLGAFVAPGLRLARWRRQHAAV